MTIFLSILFSILVAGFIIIVYRSTKTDFEDKESEMRDKYYEQILNKRKNETRLEH